MKGLNTVKKVVELHGKSVALLWLNNALAQQEEYDFKKMYTGYYSESHYDIFNLSFTFNLTEQGLEYWIKIRDSLL